MSEAPLPLISVVVATFNAEATLVHCIESFQRQTYLRKELLVIDGGSIDETTAIIRRYANVVKYWVSEPDTGVYNAWNKALERVSGDWICFLGADDFLWSVTSLEEMASALRDTPDCIRVVYGQLVVIDLAGVPVRSYGQPWADSRQLFMQRMNIPHVGTMHKRALFADHGFFDESFRIAGDYELLLRELLGGEARFVPGLTIAGHRIGGLSTRIENELAIWLEVRRARRKHGLGLGDPVSGRALELAGILLRRVLHLPPLLRLRRRIAGWRSGRRR